MTQPGKLKKPVRGRNLRSEVTASLKPFDPADLRLQFAFARFAERAPAVYETLGLLVASHFEQRFVAGAGPASLMTPGQRQRLEGFIRKLQTLVEVMDALDERERFFLDRAYFRMRRARNGGDDPRAPNLSFADFAETLTELGSAEVRVWSGQWRENKGRGGRNDPHIIAVMSALRFAQEWARLSGDKVTGSRRAGSYLHLIDIFAHYVNFNGSLRVLLPGQGDPGPDRRIETYSPDADFAELRRAAQLVVRQTKGDKLPSFQAVLSKGATAR